MNASRPPVSSLVVKKDVLLRQVVFYDVRNEVFYMQHKSYNTDLDCMTHLLTQGCNKTKEFVLNWSSLVIFAFMVRYNNINLSCLIARGMCVSVFVCVTLLFLRFCTLILFN